MSEASGPVGAGPAQEHDLVRGRTRVRPIPRKGHGLVATERIGAGEIIEENFCLVLSAAESNALSATRLRHYVYFWREGADGDEVALAMGNLSFCNHSARANASIELSAQRRVVGLRARRTIERGEEITIDYEYALDFTVHD